MTRQAGCFRAAGCVAAGLFFGSAACDSNGPTAVHELGFGTVELSGAVERSAQLPAVVTPGITVATDSFLFGVSVGGITDDVAVTLPIVAAADPPSGTYPAVGASFSASVQVGGGVRGVGRVFDAVSGTIQLDSILETAWVGSFAFVARDSTDAEVNATGTFRAATPASL